MSEESFDFDTLEDVRVETKPTKQSWIDDLPETSGSTSIVKLETCRRYYGNIRRRKEGFDVEM